MRNSKVSALVKGQWEVDVLELLQNDNGIKIDAETIRCIEKKEKDFKAYYMFRTAGFSIAETEGIIEEYRMLESTDAGYMQDMIERTLEFGVKKFNEMLRRKYDKELEEYQRGHFEMERGVYAIYNGYQKLFSENDEFYIEELAREIVENARQQVVFLDGVKAEENLTLCAMMVVMREFSRATEEPMFRRRVIYESEAYLEMVKKLRWQEDVNESLDRVDNKKIFTFNLDWKVRENTPAYRKEARKYYMNTVEVL